MYLSPGSATEPAIPIFPEETQKEDAKETFEESKGIYTIHTWEKQITGVTQLQIVHGYFPYFVLSHDYLQIELDGTTVT